MSERPADEPLWDSLSAIMLGFNETLRDRMPLQRRLKAASPALAQRTQAFGAQFRTDLVEWAVQQHGDGLSTTLQLNLLQAAAGTAYQTWAPEESFDDYLGRLQRCLDQARPAAGTTHSV